MKSFATSRRVAVAACVWTFLGLSVPQSGRSDATGVATDTAHRPRVGLVLAGGGAKGGAHVGVLKVLEELHVPIDCIAGTSMGALVGAGYASGIPAAELERFITGIEWGKVVGGQGRRALEPMERQRGGATCAHCDDL